jgi:septum formation protein
MMELVLASTSPARRTLLTQAGLTFKVVAPLIDEAALKATMIGVSSPEVALRLAVAKAEAVARQAPDAMVIGADQVLNCEGRVFEKPLTSQRAQQQLERLRGREHCLETAICCARGADILWHHVGRAKLVMRYFSDEFLKGHLEQLRSEDLTSVGGYRLEGPGVQLFEAVEGDYFTILGLPLLPLLAFLRSQEAIAS